jgi:lipopolysaccharide/colanic/teichoic acid biosynthesis glycosyltransferase
MKRAIDVLVSALLLVLLSPVLAAVAVAVAADTGGPVLFRQTRIGLRGREFSMYKFRSMVVNAAALGPHHTASDDARITRVGRFLRRTSLDELPQLLNVLKGDMSLVGPRPDLPAQRTHYSDEQWALRCSVRPGITGLAQAQLRSAATPEQRCELDLQYAREASVWLDLRIMLHTLRTLRSGRGN